ncbi:helix-turn-helix domain-containing protein [Hydrogenophaga sp. PBL-H3]|uniref:helix-turn-helix domain-containing protein n=1 Tax=Hydrogenophaga sp. PBL-H3 TaxID=434010 RepID=UPI00132027AD|nr:hypothetical protein [Hydrogenophaga sp. PBL-H3]QHE76911.1 hypothetical protein F9Z45_13040 [Hydrogenophaga sp. PBL-H3]QHE81335.1 hypothetical protein F9Z44_13040 [Hydrogenophaga sp. PBL-H3]
MSIAAQLLDQVLASALQAGMDQAHLARAAGLAPETVSRAKKRGTMDLASIAALARVAGLQLGLAPVATPRQAMVKQATQPTRSPLADPKWGLAWSNPDLDDMTLIRNALAKGGFMLLLEAVKAHGLEAVLAQWGQVKPGLKPNAQAEVERQLRNIQEGVSHAQA